jgi:hypothetical protein
MRFIRYLLLGLLLLGVGVMVEPDWDSSRKTLSLRIRDGAELAMIVRKRARSLGERMVEATDEDELPSVSAGPRPMPREPGDRLTDADQRRLDRLIEEKTREH